MPHPIKSHDLELPDWGPYSKRYAGISHIPDRHTGLRFDLTVIPGHYRRQMLIPSEKWASGHHAWQAAPDLSYYSYRYEIEWKDQVYADVSFAAASAQARLVRCRFVNTTDLPQNLMLHLVGSMNFPPLRPYSDEPIRPARVALPPGAVWVDALDYADLQFATPRPTDSLVPDGMLRAEIRANNLVGGGGVGGGFGRAMGDRVSFRFELPQALPRAALSLRYRLTDAGPVRFGLEGAIHGTALFTDQERDGQGMARLVLPVGALAAGAHTLTLTSQGGGAVELDGFAVTNIAQAREVVFTPHLWRPTPEIGPGPTPNSLIMRYADTPVVYGLAWDHPDFWVRQLLHDELDILLRHLVPNNYSTVVHGSGQGHFTDVFIRPITLAPHGQATLDAFVCAGSEAEVAAALADSVARPAAARDAIEQAARARAVALDCLPAGERYRFSQERMAATMLMNVVYPVYTRRQYIRHNTPGKWWDCLYTWDSGFIALGLLELDQRRAIDCLSAYLTVPGDPHAAFVHHGTPVPVQIYVLHELWSRTQDRELLAALYPSMRQYYLFMAGRYGSSTTRRLKSNLLITWEYFFESAGWDDYPAQMEVLRDYEHEGSLQESGIEIGVACAAITAHAIRSAKVLAAAAEALGLSADVALYQEDSATFTDALQRFAWDERAGYFSYVEHDAGGNPTGALYHVSGVNFNMGLDGVMPLFAGACTPAQQALLLARLADPARFWTPIGLATVDQSAPYYRKDGYWNGAVWFPHQWFIWKAALDLGAGDFAYQIAQTALELWQREVAATYYCFEHFLVESGRGAGWHQFGGLSSPVLAWFGAYHMPGRLTTGFDIWVERQAFSADHRTFTGRLRHMAGPKTVTVIVTMRPGSRYRVRWGGQDVEYREIHLGCFQIQIPFDTPEGTLELTER